MPFKVWDPAPRHWEPNPRSLDGFAEKDPRDRLSSLLFTRDGTPEQFVCHDKAHAVTLWDSRLRREIPVCRVHKPSATAFSLDGQTRATTSDDGSVKLWKVVTRREMATLTLTGARREDNGWIAFTRDGTLLAADGANKTILLWRAASRSEVP
jgi:WD40 repeat protein